MTSHACKFCKDTGYLFARFYTDGRACTACGRAAALAALAARTDADRAADLEARRLARRARLAALRADADA